MHVLVADDDDDIRFLLTTVLRRQGWSVTTAGSGDEALGLLESSAFDAAVLDQQMPPGSGLEVARSRRAAGDAIPMVLFTGYAPTIDLTGAEADQVVLLDKGDVGRLVQVLSDLAS